MRLIVWASGAEKLSEDTPVNSEDMQAKISNKIINLASSVVV